MISPMIHIATTQYQVVIHFVTLPAHALRSGPMGFAIPGAWPCSAARTEFLLTMLAVTSLKKSTKAIPAAITAGLWTKGTRTTPIYVRLFLLTATVTGFPVGCAIIGGAFYNPPVQRFPSQYVGKYFFADYCNWWIDVLDLTTHTASAFATGLRNLSDMDVGPDGNLYYLRIDLTTGTSTVNRISYTGNLAPHINTQPADQLAPVGYPATFTVGADGEPPLTYQWQRNGVTIQDATSASYTTPVVALSDNGATYRCVITNPFGNTTSRAAVLTVTTKQPPVPTITLPAPNTYYEAGDTITFSGSAVDGHDIVTGDPQDGVLGPSAFTWQVLFEHHPLNNPNIIHHPFFPPTSGIASGDFSIPTSGETDPDVWYRIIFTARDSYGLSTTIIRDIYPRHVKMKVTTSPVLFPVKVDGSPKSAPYPFWSVVNLTRSIGVDSPQVLNGIIYDFVSWSDGGARFHNVSAPRTATGYVANFWKRAGYGSITANPNPIRVNDGSGKGATTLYWSSGQTNRWKCALALLEANSSRAVVQAASHS